MSDLPHNDRLKKLLLVWPEKAIEYFYEYYYDRLIYISQRRTHNREASEDIVQDAFTEVWQNHQRIATNNTILVVPYLFAIVKNKSITFYNSVLRQNDKSRHVNDELFFTNQMNETDWSFLEEDKPIWHIIASFPPREKECLILKHRQGMSNEEIALHLHVSKKAVERSITSAYRRLRKYDPSELRKKSF